MTGAVRSMISGPSFRPGQSFRYVSASCSHVGMVRQINEDAVLDRSDLGLWAVADGMGGHSAGDYASRLIVQSLDGVAPPAAAGPFLADVRTRLKDVNRHLRETAGDGDGRRMIGSTVVALLGFGGYYCCLWAGDSRAYRLRGGELVQITRDHSHVQELVERGLLAPEQAAGHRLANVITRAVGVDDELTLDKRNERAYPSDVFLLCSDGLTRNVSDQEIAGLLGCPDIGEAIDRLVDLALERGAPDNVSAVAVRWHAAAPNRR